MWLRATTKIRNDSIIAARKALGLSQINLGKAIGVSVNIISELEKLDFSRRTSMGHAKKVAEFLDLDMEEVLPKELQNKFIETDIMRTAEVDSAKLMSLVENRRLLPQPSAAQAVEVNESVKKAISLLTETEKEVLELRYGFDGDSQTRKNTGNRLRMTKSCVELVERSALKKLTSIISPKIKPERARCETELLR